MANELSLTLTPPGGRGTACPGCYGHPWNHERFCKTMDSPVAIDLFKRIEILRIVYILAREQCKEHQTRFGRMLQIEKCVHGILNARTADLWELGDGNLGAL